MTKPNDRTSGSAPARPDRYARDFNPYRDLPEDYFQDTGHYPWEEEAIQAAEERYRRQPVMQRNPWWIALGILLVCGGLAAGLNPFLALAGAFFTLPFCFLNSEGLDRYLFVAVWIFAGIGALVFIFN